MTFTDEQVEAAAATWIDECVDCHPNAGWPNDATLAYHAFRAGWLALATLTPPPAGELTDDTLITYILRYGGMCRQCADEDGICPNSGLPCEVPLAQSAVRRVLEALRYGVANGYIRSPLRAIADEPEGKSHVQ